MYRGDYCGGTTTADIDWYELRDDSVREIWADLVEVIPKWWRWYDIFRTWADMTLLPMTVGAVNCIKKNQAPVDIKQRRKQKRRMFVQRLLST